MKRRTEQAQQKNNIKYNGDNKSNQVKWHVMRALGGASRGGGQAGIGGPTRAGILLVWRPRRCRTTQHQQQQQQQEQEAQTRNRTRKPQKAKRKNCFVTFAGNLPLTIAGGHSVPRKSRAENASRLQLLLLAFLPDCRCR